MSTTECDYHIYISRIGNAHELFPQTLSGGATDDYYWTYWVVTETPLRLIYMSHLEIKSLIYY